MPHQYGETLDERLNVLGRDIEAAEAKITEGTNEKDEAWSEIDAIRGEVAPNGAFRFIANNGRTYAFQFREGSIKFDAKKFQTMLFHEFDEKKATRIWNSITERALNMALLEVAVRTKKVPEELVKACTTEAPGSYARVHPEWTKEDVERAKIFGVEKVD